MNHLPRFAWLLVLWIALWSDLSWANIVGGTGIAVLVMVAFRTQPLGRVVFRPVPALFFLGYFLVKLVESTFVVALTVMLPRGRTHSGIVAVPLRGCSDTIAAVVSATISLTPGSLTLEARREPRTLFVHLLHVRDIEAVRRDVLRLERLALRAFGDAKALEGTVGGATESPARDRSTAHDTEDDS